MLKEETITVDDMTRWLGIESLEAYDNRTMEYCECCSKGEEVWNAQTSEYEIANHDYTCEVCSLDYRGKVIEFFSILLEKFELELDGNEDNLTWKIIPKRGWFRSAKELIETINGFGLFHFGTVGEAIRSGPYEGAKGFVLNHLSWISEYYNVYEGSKASHVFERWWKR